MKFTTQLALLVVAATATNALTIPDQAVDARSLEVRQNSVPEIVGDLIGVASGGSPEEIATNALILGIEYVMNGFNRLTDAIKKDKIVSYPILLLSSSILCRLEPRRVHEGPGCGYVKEESQIQLCYVRTLRDVF